MKSKLETAYGLHLQKKFAEALKIYEELEKNNPNDSNLMQLMGALYLEINKLDIAKNYLINAEKLLPNFAQIKNNLSLISKKQGNIEESIYYVKKAIECDPKFYDAHYNYATLLFVEKKYKKAIEEYSEAEKINKKMAIINNNKGVAYQKIGEKKLAEKEFITAIKKDKKYAEPLNNLANLIKEIDHKRAEELYLKAIEIEEKIDYIDNYISFLIQIDNIKTAENIIEKYTKNKKCAILEVKLGVIYAKKGKKQEAIEKYKNALKIDPDVIGANKNIGLICLEENKYQEAYNYFTAEGKVTSEEADNKFDLANALMGLKRIKEAFALYEDCIRLKPHQVEYINNYGSALYTSGKFKEAIDILTNGLEINKKFKMIYINLAQCYERLFDYKNASSIYKKAIELWPDDNELRAKLFLDNRYMCDWNNYSEIIYTITNGVENESFPMVPFAALSFFDDPTLVYKATKGWIKDRFKMDEIPAIKKYNNRKIKIAYFSPDYKNHPVSYLISSLFSHHNRNKFEVYAIGYGPVEEDYFHKKVIAGVDKYIDINQLTDYQAALLCRELQIDIAIDLAGYTQNCRTELFKFRVAPIQTSYLGFVGSMGLEQYDYLIADKVIIPDSHRKFYNEKIMYLDNYQCNDNERFVGDEQLNPLEFGLPQDKFIFCCFNNSYKITPEIFKIWMEILFEVKDSVIFLYSENIWQIENLKKEAITHNIDPERIIFSGKIPIAKYLARFQLCHLFLDTSPYNAGTTCSDALWAELPVLTYLGNSFAARMAASILISCGLSDLVCKDINEYKNKAIFYGNNFNEYQKIKNAVKRNKILTNHFNIKHYCKNLEYVYEESHKLLSNNLSFTDVGPLSESIEKKSDFKEIATTKVFLHVGCGSNRKDRTTKALSSWNELRFDIDESVNPDLIGNMTDLSSVSTTSVDAVFSAHSIQHLHPHEAPKALAEFLRVLKPDGFALITCPDLQAVCALIAEDKFTETVFTSHAGPIAPVDILFGLRSAIENGNIFMPHRCGFTEKVLVGTLESVGFKRVASMKRGAPFYDLWAIATKENMNDEALRSLVMEHLTPI